MLEGLGLGEGALPRFVRTAYHMLGLRTFFTTGEKESRAWTFRAGWKAPQCAGVIHTDFETRLHPRRGHPLGRAARHRLVVEGRDVGKLRVEGKDYEVADGDVIEIRFNV